MKKILKKPATICALVGGLVAVIVAAVFAIPEVEVVAPTCLEKGYTVYAQYGKTRIKDVVDALGHSFTEWNVEIEPSEIAGGKRTRVCQTCGVEETDIFHENNGLPQLFLTGDISEISKTNQANVKAQMSGNEEDFDGYALIKYQGHNSLQYDKKNYTIKFFSDKKCNDKHKFSFLDWNEEHKYILKACYTDTSRSRNLIGTDLWSQMVATREKIHPRLAETSNYGATDGYPVELYINDSFAGIYVLSLHKDDDLFGMVEEQKDGVVIVNDAQTPAAMFQEMVDWDLTEDWELEFCGTESVDSFWLRKKVNNFIRFVVESGPKSFHAELSQHADVESLIDYMILMYALGMPDHSSKDMVLATYEDSAFIVNMYDMKEAFGLLPDGSGFIPVDQGLPVMQDGVWNSGTGNRLWDRMLELFYPEIQARYAQLRADILSEDNIIEIINKRVSAVPENVNQADMELYAGQPQQDLDHSEQMKEFISQRLALLDGIFGG